jgi:hypothetical protein
MNQYRNRIVERIEVRAGDILPNLRNPKRHDQKQTETLNAIFQKFGIVDALIAYRSARNGGKLTYFDGHGRNLTDPDQTWPVDVTDLTDEEVDQLVLYFDEVGRMAKPDHERLADLLRQADLENPSLAALAAFTAKNARLDMAGLLSGAADDLLMLSSAPPLESFGIGPGGADGDDASLPLADIKVVQLYFTTAQREEFLTMSDRLAGVFRTNSTTDTAMEAMKYAHSELAT